MHWQWLVMCIPFVGWSELDHIKTWSEMSSDWSIQLTCWMVTSNIWSVTVELFRNSSIKSTTKTSVYRRPMVNYSEPGTSSKTRKKICSVNRRDRTRNAIDGEFARLSCHHHHHHHWLLMPACRRWGSSKTDDDAFWPSHWLIDSCLAEANDLGWLGTVVDKNFTLSKIICIPYSPDVFSVINRYQSMNQSLFERKPTCWWAVGVLFHCRQWGRQQTAGRTLVIPR